jgi:hypothetical protein
MVGRGAYAAAAVLCGLAFLGSTPRTAAAVECYPHCDYHHQYGPYDLTYIRPGLFAYPVCNARGNCAPWSVYVQTGPRTGNVEVRFPRRPLPPRP